MKNRSKQRNPSFLFYRGFSIVCILLLGGCTLMPEPLKPEEQRLIAAQDLKAAQAQGEPVRGKITLAEATARALKYNLEHRIKLMEENLALGQLDLSRFDILPKLMAGGNSLWRDKPDENTSSPGFTFSDRKYQTANVGLSWNLLDFGLSYYSTKQNADRVLIAAEKRRKAMHTLMQDVRTAFWRAFCAEKLQDKVKNAIRLAEKTLRNAKQAEDEGLRNPLGQLRYRRTLLDSLRTLETIERELATSRIELATLMNLPPNMYFQLAEPSKEELNPKLVPLHMGEMEEIALVNNADFREHFYNARIAAIETKKSLVRLFPGLSFDYGHQYTTNSYSVNKHWEAASAQVSWNLLNLLSMPAHKKYSEGAKKIAEYKRMAAQMALLSQVHLSRQYYLNAYRQFERADSIATIDRRISHHSLNQEEEGLQSKLESVSSHTNAVVSLLRRYQALAQLYTASGRIQTTLGLELKIGSLHELSIGQLTDTIKRATELWNQGRLKALQIKQTHGQ